MLDEFTDLACVPPLVINTHPFLYYLGLLIGSAEYFDDSACFLSLEFAEHIAKQDTGFHLTRVELLNLLKVRRRVTVSTLVGLIIRALLLSLFDHPLFLFELITQETLKSMDQ